MRTIKILAGKAISPKELKPGRAPVYSQCVPRGLIGYEEFKRKIAIEAWRDHEASKAECAPEIRRQAFIAAVHRAFPQVNPKQIAEGVDPWNSNIFKWHVEEAHKRFLKELNE